MNTHAIAIGLFFGLVTMVTGYGVSMVASGLFARPVYRLYSRLLISVCSVMLLAPALQWLTGVNPVLGTIGLSVAQYAATAIFAYGVYQFNRHYLHRVYLERATTAYFIFGTLAYATVVTLVFLHVAVARAHGIAIDEQVHLTAAHGILTTAHGFLTAAHYGPLLVILAMMLFHTDTCLKESVSDPRRFTGFTFIGYAVSFVGIAVSVLPLIAQGMDRLELITLAHPWLPSASGAQALLLAILLYGWIAHRYETVPPIYMLLLAIVAEYHLLVTQWLVRSYGPETWALASLPVFAVIAFLARYFDRLDQRKQEARERHGLSAAEHLDPTRISTPFAVVEFGLAALLLLITLWTRFLPGGGSPLWLAATYAVYASFFVGESVARRRPGFLYVAGGLAALAAIFGVDPPGSPSGTLLLGLIAFLTGLMSLVGEIRGVGSKWRVPLSDLSLATAIGTTCFAFSGHLIGGQTFGSQFVGETVGIGLVLAILAFAMAAISYRSQLPVYAGLVAAFLLFPMWSAGISLAATIAAYAIDRLAGTRRRFLPEDRIDLLGRYSLPRQSELPTLWTHPLGEGSIVLAFVGLAISFHHFASGDYSTSTIVGMWMSTSALLLLTRRIERPWLYVPAIASTYLSVHATVHAWGFTELANGRMFALHLAVASGMTLVGWLLAQANAAWCGAMLKRVAEKREPIYKERRALYSGWLMHFSVCAGLFTLIGVVALLLRAASPDITLVASILLTILFALAASAYRTRLGAYIALVALTCSGIAIVQIFELAISSQAAMLAALGLIAAVIAFRPHATIGEADHNDSLDFSWVEPIPWLSAQGWGLWRRPLAHYAMLCSPLALMVVFRGPATWSITNLWRDPAPLTFLLASVTWVFISRTLRYRATYLTGILFGYAAAHSAAQLAFNQGWVKLDLESLHLDVAAMLALATTILGWLIAKRITLASRNVGGHSLDPMAERLEFDAGTLFHVGFATAGITLAGLTATLIQSGSFFASRAVAHLFAATLVALTMAVLAQVYRSRIPAYGALIAVAWGVLAATALLTTDEQLPVLSTVAMAVLAACYAIGSNWLARSRPKVPADSRRLDVVGAERRFNEFWREPPLPLTSVDSGLWAKPSMSLSIAASSIAVAQLLFVWSDAPIWMLLTPIYLAAFTWWLASVNPVLPQRATTFGFSLVALLVAIHATVQLVLLSDAAWDDRVAWHRLVAIVFAMFCWGFASVWSNRFRRRMDSRPAESSGAPRYSVHADTLYHFSFLIGIAGLASGVAYGATSISTLLPLAAGSILLTLHFAMLGGSYRSQIGSYLSLVAFGLAAFQIVSPTFVNWIELLGWIPLVASVAGLVLMLSAFFMQSRWPDDRLEQGERSAIEKPWRWPTSRPTAKFPLHGSTWRELWYDPMRHVALAFVIVGLQSLVIRLALEGSWGDIATTSAVALVAAAGSLFVATSLYRVSGFSYLAAGLVALVAFPALSTLSWSDERLGLSWSIIAIGFWIAGYAVEKIGTWKDELDTASAEVSPVLQLYERPLIRSSAAIAVLAISQSLLVWVATYPETPMLAMLAASGFSAIALLLNARSMNVLHRFAIARVLVYIAAVAMTACVISVTWLQATPSAMGPVLALSAVVFGAAGLVLAELASRWSDSDADRSQSLLTFARPLSTWGAMLSAAAICVAVGSLFRSDWSMVTHSSVWDMPALIERLPMLPVAFCLTLGGITMFGSARAFRRVEYIDLAVALSTTGPLIAAQHLLGMSTSTITMITLVLMNALVWAGRLIRRRPGTMTSLLSVDGQLVAPAFCRWPLVVASASLFVQAASLTAILVGAAPVDVEWPWLLNGLLCSVLYFHALYTRPSEALWHLLVGSTVVGFFGASLSQPWNITWDVSLGVMGLLWAVVASLLYGSAGKARLGSIGLELSDEQQAGAIQALGIWSVTMTTCAIAATLPLYHKYHPEFPTVTATLLLGALTAMIIGRRQSNVTAVTISTLLMSACTAWVMVRTIDEETLKVIGPLVISIVSLIYIAVAFLLRRRSAEPTTASSFAASVARSMIALAITFSVLAIGATVAAMVLLSPSILFVAAMLSVSVGWLWMAWESGKEPLVYGSAIAVFAAVLYASTSLLGLELVRTPLAAFAVMGYSFVLYGINVLVGRSMNSRAVVLGNPTYFMAIGAPLALTVVTPVDSRAIAAFVFLAAGAFYLLVSHRSANRWTQYIAAALFNVAIYLWIPEARQATGLLQLYVIPAAITVLIFAQLHRRDLKPSTLNGIRTAAASAILAISTYEVFFSEATTLVHFVAVLALSLGGIAIGISLRIRPFVLVGIAFLVINVLGQLGMQFHREGGVARAVILIGTGLVVLGMMVFFNVHRERIMSRYRGFLKDESWK